MGGERSDDFYFPKGLNRTREGCSDAERKRWRINRRRARFRMLTLAKIWHATGLSTGELKKTELVCVGYLNFPACLDGTKMKASKSVEWIKRGLVWCIPGEFRRWGVSRGRGWGPQAGTAFAIRLLKAMKTGKLFSPHLRGTVARALDWLMGYADSCWSAWVRNRTARHTSSSSHLSRCVNAL